MGNILLTTLSVPGKGKRITYAYGEKNEEKYYCANIASHEGGSKFFLSEYDIDKIVVIGSKETYNKNDELAIKNLSDYILEDSFAGLSVYGVYIRRMADYLSGNSIESDRRYCKTAWELTDMDETYMKQYLDDSRLKLEPCEGNRIDAEHNNIEIVFLPEKKETGIFDYQKLINRLRGKESVNNIYMDIQAGSRTSSFVRNSIVQLISGQNVYKAELKQVVAIDYNPENPNPFENPIKDETQSYYISDFFAGIRALLSYGKIGGLESYLKKMRMDDVDSIKQLIDALKNIDISFSSNNIKDIETQTESLDIALTNLREKAQGETREGTDTEMLFSILEDGIRKEYQPLFGNNILDILEWCVGKQLYSAAATLAESRLPRFFVEKGMIYCVDNEILKKYMQYYTCVDPLRDKFKYQNPYIYLVKYYRHKIKFYDPVNNAAAGKRTIGPVALASFYSLEDDLKNRVSNIFELYDLLSDIRNRQSHGDDFSKKKLYILAEKLLAIGKNNKSIQKYIEKNIKQGEDRIKAIQGLLLNNATVLELLGVVIETLISACRSLFTIKTFKGEKTLLIPQNVKEEERIPLVQELLNREIGTIEQDGTFEKNLWEVFYSSEKVRPLAYVLDPMLHQIKRYTELEGKNDESYINYIKDGRNKEFRELIQVYFEDEYPDMDSIESFLKKPSSKNNSEKLQYMIWQEMIKETMDFRELPEEDWIKRYQTIKEKLEAEMSQKQEDTDITSHPMYNTVVDFLRGHSWKDILLYYVDDPEKVSVLWDKIKVLYDKYNTIK